MAAAVTTATLLSSASRSSRRTCSDGCSVRDDSYTPPSAWWSPPRARSIKGVASFSSLKRRSLEVLRRRHP
ncbi:hypothetical protein ABZP36_022039 [Zizania latifolia]